MGRLPLLYLVYMLKLAGRRGGGAKQHRSRAQLVYNNHHIQHLALANVLLFADTRRVDGTTKVEKKPHKRDTGLCLQRAFLSLKKSKWGLSRISNIIFNVIQKSSSGTQL